ncbi:hypothetical protein H4582DRAFT_2052351 [Lactarius indigo]|nr:hypothetical protein H4582DRAFT_2052351 [Lactarius indigo]
MASLATLVGKPSLLAVCQWSILACWSQGRGKWGKAGVASLSGPGHGVGPPALSFVWVETLLGNLDLHTGDHGVDVPTLLCPLMTLDRPSGHFCPQKKNGANSMGHNKPTKSGGSPLLNWNLDLECFMLTKVKWEVLDQLFKTEVSSMHAISAIDKFTKKFKLIITNELHASLWHAAKVTLQVLNRHCSAPPLIQDAFRPKMPPMVNQRAAEHPPNGTDDGVQARAHLQATLSSTCFSSSSYQFAC